MKDTKKSVLRRLLLGEGRLSQRFRNINILLFLLAFCIMAAVMVTAFNVIVSGISSEYAGSYATSSADALSARVSKEISLLAAAARSDHIIAWLKDEENEDQRTLALKDLSDTMSELYSNNLYVIVGESLNEFKVEDDYQITRGSYLFTLEPGDPEDSWYFETIMSDHDYTLTVAIDDVLSRKRVFINYIVVSEGVPVGAISTGLEFSHIAGELFYHFYLGTTRGLIIDENGGVLVDSHLLENEDFLHHEYDSAFDDLLPQPILIDAIRRHLDSIDGYFGATSEPVVVRLTNDPYHFATIAPIRNTSWTVVIIYDSSSSLEMPLFIPIAVAMLVVLVVFAFVTNIVSYRLIFLPFDKLRQSLARLKEDNEESIYGADRNDELGELSNSIKDWFIKANYDALTGIRNRRFMETNLQHVMRLLSRSAGRLCVFMVDVDFFKNYNDTYGHEKGDVCLKSVAQAISASVTRSCDFAARYGGEEFAVVLPNTDQAGACAIAEKLLENVRSLKLPHKASEAASFVTVSVGVTTGMVTYEQSWEDYLNRADQALYISKQTGRNQYTYIDME